MPLGVRMSGGREPGPAGAGGVAAGVVAGLGGGISVPQVWCWSGGCQNGRSSRCERTSSVPAWRHNDGHGAYTPGLGERQWEALRSLPMEMRVTVKRGERMLDMFERPVAPTA